ncbi:MAG TPA: ferredoxin [Candidatus Dormibacteraeota bacterium]|nr:ferredoxin [Candidatus Dormibacteraeota bacterium]
MKSLYLHVNPITCAGHGLCAELLPEAVRLDDWGYPIVDPSPVSPRIQGHARRAVAACPTLALALRSAPARGVTSPQRGES